MISDTLLITLFLFVPALALNIYRIISVNNAPFLGDAFTYLRLAKEIKHQKTLFPKMNFYHTGQEERLNLPPLLMLLLAPVSHWPYRRLMHTSLVLDLMIGVAVYLFAAYGIGLPPPYALVAAGVQLLTPINAVTTASLTPRPLGLLWFTLFLAAVTVHATEGGITSFLVAAGATTLLLLSQRMITQIVVLVSPLVLAALWFFKGVLYFELLLIIFCGILGATAITKGQYLHVARDHLQRILLHARHGQQERFKREFGNPLQIIKANPWILIAATHLLLQGTPGDPLWITTAYASGILLLAVLWVMGNSVNHIYFSSPAIALLVASGLSQESVSPIFMVLCAAVCVIFIYRELKVITTRRIKNDWFDCFKYINDFALEGRALVIPRVSFPPLIYYTQLVMASSGHGSKAITYDRLTLRKNISNVDYLARFVKENDIRYLIIDLSATTDTQALVHEQNAMGLEERYRNQTLLLLETLKS
jgi:hypothetical protein